MTNLRTTLSQLANEFANGVLRAIRGASLEEILAESGQGGSAKRGRPPAVAAHADPAVRGRRRRRGRRSAKDIAGVVQDIVDLLGSHPEGLRAEQIRHALGLDAKDLPRPIGEALSSRKIVKQGQKRATTYFAKGSKGKSAAAKGGKRGSKKRAAARPARGRRQSSKRSAVAQGSSTNGTGASA